MKLRDAIRAYGAVMELQEAELGYRTAHALVVLKKRLQPHAEYFAKEEMKLAEKYAKKDAEGKIVWIAEGRFSMDETKGEMYVREKAELERVPLQEEWDPLKAPAPEKIQPRQLEALEGWIEWEA